jgi:carbonic anhydrase
MFPVDGSLADSGRADFANAQAFCAYPRFREEPDQVAFSPAGWLASLESFDRNRIDRTRREEQVPSVFRGDTDVNSLDLMLERNKVFAAQQSEKHILMPSLPQALPNLKAVIIGCADMRVDPANLLGLEPGEAVVMRNIGGRVTPGLLEQLGLLGRIGQVAGAIPGGGGEFHLIILQHTDCGITRLVGDPAMLTQYFQIPDAQLPAKTVLDPRAAVTSDVALLRAIPALPPQWLISGLVYDVATGLVEVVIPPSPLRST